MDISDLNGFSSLKCNVTFISLILLDFQKRYFLEFEFETIFDRCHLFIMG